MGFSSYSGYSTAQSSLLTPVRVAATSNVTGSYVNGTKGVGSQFIGTGAGVLTIDGVTPTLNERVALTAQTTGLQNGVYVVTNTGSTSAAFVLTRAPDLQTGAQYLPGMHMTVTDGTANAASFLILKYPAPVNVDTDTITWVKK